MSYSNFKHIDQVILQYGLNHQQKKFITPKQFPIKSYIQENLVKKLANPVTFANEMAARERIIYPMFDIVLEQLVGFELFSDATLNIDDDLKGNPDYLIAKKKATITIDKPILCAMEAKNNDFVFGLGQCSAAMVASQIFNNNPKQTIAGVVTDGQSFLFSKLNETNITVDPKRHDLNEDSIADILYLIFGLLDS